VLGSALCRPSEALVMRVFHFGSARSVAKTVIICAAAGNTREVHAVVGKRQFPFTGYGA
jgi:hypothetical protein